MPQPPPVADYVEDVQQDEDVLNEAMPITDDESEPELDVLPPRTSSPRDAEAGCPYTSSRCGRDASAQQASASSPRDAGASCPWTRSRCGRDASAKQA